MSDKSILEVKVNAEYQKYVTDTYDHIKKEAKELLEGGLNSAIVLQLTDVAMRHVAKFRDLCGYEKKVIVCCAIRKYVEEMAKEAQSHLESAIDQVEGAHEKLTEELRELHVVLDKALGPYIDQLVTLAPEVYGETQKRLGRLRAKLRVVFKCL